MRFGTLLRQAVKPRRTSGGSPPASEFYKTATLTGAAPSGHPVMLQVHQYQPQIAGLGAATVLATDKGANQGIAASAAHYFTTGGLNVDPDNSCVIRVFNTSWIELFSYDIRAANGGPVALGVTQANGMHFVTATNKLYVSTMNFPTTPKVSQVLEYDYNPATGALTYAAQYNVGDMHSEGCALYDGDWWVVGTDKYEIWQFDSSWTLIQVHTLPGSAPTVSGIDLYQGIAWIGNVAICNLHNSNPNAPRADTFYWTGSEFIASEQVVPPQYCSQGLHLTPDGTAMLWAKRTNDSATSGDDVVSTPLISPATGVSLEGRARSDFLDVRITTADGMTTLAGNGAGWLEKVITDKTAFFHFALPGAITTTMDFRVYYGSGVAGAASTDSASVTLHEEDFESTNGGFVGYTSGSAAQVAGIGLDGTGGLQVTGTGTGDGAYSPNGTYLGQGLRKLTGWVNILSGQATTLPSVFFMTTVSGSTQRRGAIQFTGQNVVALSNSVVQPYFASLMGLNTWIRFEILYDYANSDFGAKVWDQYGVLRGNMPITTWTLDSASRTYRDVLLFRTMKADRFFSQALLATEPSWGAWSAETSA